MRVTGRIIVAISALASVQAHANDKTDFATCDGRVHPGKQDDGMRGLAGVSRWEFSANAQNETIAACTRALSSPRLLSTQSLRRAHLLRARAAARLRAGDTRDGIADLDLAEAAAASLATNTFYQRSMGTSLTLLRAIALAQSGDTAGAVPLANAAIAARPYSLQVQQAAATVLQTGRASGGVSSSPWSSAARLDPESAVTALLHEAEIGNFPAVVAMSQALATEWPTEKLSPTAFAVRTRAAAQLAMILLPKLHAAYARAATGDAEGARRDLTDVRTHITALRPEATAANVDAVGGPTYSQLDKFVDLHAHQIEARIAVTEKRPADALAALIATPMPRNAASAELLTALKAALPADKAALIPDATPFMADAAKERLSELAGAIPNALIAPETPRSVIDYSRARPDILRALVAGAFSMGTSLLGGIGRTDGFRSTNNPDGTIKVEFIGNTPSPALVQEMTLLRAAEITRAAGKPSFVIVKRADYSRRMATTQYGMEISSVPTGFKSELTIRCLETGQESARALDAVGIIDALGPIYYEAGKTV